VNSDEIPGMNLSLSSEGDLLCEGLDRGQVLFHASLKQIIVIRSRDHEEPLVFVICS
jgi:hypothetical protein